MKNSLSTKSRRPRNKSLGQLLSHSIEGQQITLQTDCGTAHITPYSDSVIRLRIFQGEPLEDFSYAVVGTPQTLEVKIEEQADKILVETALLRLEVEKNPVRFRFLTKEGQVINEDEAGFGTSWIGEQVTTYKKLQESERFMGLGEKTGGLDRRGNGYVNWNQDAYGYTPWTDPLYASCPFYIGAHSGVSYGIYFDNSYKSHFNFGASNDRFASFMAEGGEMNYYFIHQPTVAGIIESFTWLTGRMSLPPMWSIGFQQCRYSYYPDREILELARNFRERKIPCDVIHFDIHHMDAYKVFTFHPQNFANPKAVLSQLKTLGFEVVVIADPGVKIEEGYKAYEEGKEQELFLMYPDGTPYAGDVWPGRCNFPDFTNPKAREWWGKLFEFYTEVGVHGFWNDMNEIATWGKMSPELIEFDLEGLKTSHREGHNLYGMQMSRATFEGTKKLLNGKRPFILTRAAFAGSQRYTAIWTGDNNSGEDDMLQGVRLVNSLGLSGVAFSGFDVSGFTGDCSPACYARWIAIGAFTPFFRVHSSINTRDHEPWSLGEEVEEISRNYINFRYRLLPYLYSLFFEASQTGMPVSRSLAIDYTHDANIYDGTFHNQFLFGLNILVAPVRSDVSLVKIYLPEGGWYDLHSETYYDGSQVIIYEASKEKLPIFVKAGGFLLMQSQIQTTAQITDGILTIHLYKGAQDSDFLYYEDDGTTYEYESGMSHQRTVSYTSNVEKLTFEESKGALESKFSHVKVVFHGYGDDLRQGLVLNGERLHPELEEVEFFKPLTRFDPFYDASAPRDVLMLPAVIFKNQSEELVLEW